MRFGGRFFLILMYFLVENKPSAFLPCQHNQCCCCFIHIILTEVQTFPCIKILFLNIFFYTCPSFSGPGEKIRNFFLSPVNNRNFFSVGNFFFSCAVIYSHKILIFVNFPQVLLVCFGSSFTLCRTEIVQNLFSGSYFSPHT